jgi:hypothetical protein
VSRILTTIPAHFNLLTRMHVTRSASVFNLYSSSFIRILYTPLTSSSLNVLRNILYSPSACFYRYDHD